jgi:hypothetical protein
MYRYIIPLSSLTVAYWLLASGHDERLHRPLKLYSFLQKRWLTVLKRKSTVLQSVYMTKSISMHTIHVGHNVGLSWNVTMFFCNIINLTHNFLSLESFLTEIRILETHGEKCKSCKIIAPHLNWSKMKVQCKCNGSNGSFNWNGFSSGAGA